MKKRRTLKNILIGLVVCFSLMPAPVFADCLDDFSSDFWSAYDEYQDDLRRCSNVLISNRPFCKAEAELSFSAAVESAADKFACCCCAASLSCCGPC